MKKLIELIFKILVILIVAIIILGSWILADYLSNIITMKIVFIFLGIVFTIFIIKNI